MTAKTATAEGLSKQESKYLDAIDDSLREMTRIRRSMKKTDAELRRLEVSSRRKLDEIWTIIRHVEATL
jgi:hypothetical protein